MSYLAAVGIMLFVMSPLLVPLLISGVHGIAGLAETRRARNFGAQTRDVAVTG